MDELARAFDRGKRRALVLAAGQPPLVAWAADWAIFYRPCVQADRVAFGCR